MLTIEPHDWPGTADAKPGDILLHRHTNQDFLGEVITKITHSEYSHAEVYYGEGWSLSAEGRGVMAVQCDRGGKSFVDLCRHVDLDAGDAEEAGARETIVRAAAQRLGDPYDVATLVMFPFMGRTEIERAAKNDAAICSELVADAYREAGLRLSDRVYTPEVAPADISRGGKVRLVGSYLGSTKVEGTQLDVYDRRQGTDQFDAANVISFMIRLFSSVDDEYEEMSKAL